jgi:mycofactocin precursor
MVEPATTTQEVDIDADASRDEDDAVAALVEEDLLVEDVSIDGMCGVY